VAENTEPKHVQCPACNGYDVRRSYPKGLIDRFMMGRGKSPLRCRGCQKRFYYKLTNERLGRPDLSEEKDPVI
jgi:uncharacterized protein with PIN domain